MPKTTLTLAALIVAIFATTTAAEARHHRHHHYRHHEVAHHKAATRAAVAQDCEYTNDGRVLCLGAGQRISGPPIEAAHGDRRRISRLEAESGVRFIPNPPGTWRVRASCAHRLAAYWGLGGGLDAVATWPQVFRRASGPAIGVAAVRNDRHHIMGIIGGGPGGYVVADFNSGGHLNREYTVANFSGYFFVDTRTRMASR